MRIMALLSSAMSPAKLISSPTLPLHPAVPSPSKTHCFVTSLPNSSISIQKHAPLFSTACALFLIRNSVYSSCFVEPAHSLPKTPGGRVGLSNQIPGEIPNIHLTPTKSVSFTRITLNPIESYSFARFAPKPNGILLFHHEPRGWGSSGSILQVL